MIAWYWLIVAGIFGCTVGFFEKLSVKKETQRIERLILRFGQCKGYFTGFQIAHEIEQELHVFYGFSIYYQALHNLQDAGLVLRKEEENPGQPKRILWKLIEKN